MVSEGTDCSSLPLLSATAPLPPLPPLPPLEPLPPLLPLPLPLSTLSLPLLGALLVSSPPATGKPQGVRTPNDNENRSAGMPNTAHPFAAHTDPCLLIVRTILLAKLCTQAQAAGCNDIDDISKFQKHKARLGCGSCQVYRQLWWGSSSSSNRPASLSASLRVHTESSSSSSGL